MWLPALPLCGAVCAGGAGEGARLLTWNLSYFQSLYTLPVCNWCPTSCCSGGGSQSGWVCVYSRTLRALWMDSPGRLAVFFFFLVTQPPLLFTEIMRLYFPCAGTLCCVVWPEVGIAHSQGIPPDFYPSHVNVVLPIPPATTTPHPLRPGSPSPPLPSMWMNMTSLNTWLSDFHTVRLSGSSGYFLFWN